MKTNRLFFIFSFFLIICCNSTEQKNDPSASEDSNRNKFELTGTVKKLKHGPSGTFSEYSYFVLDTGEKSESLIINEFENVLFNKADRVSRGFEEYVDKKVRITGTETTGYVGPRKEEKPGILVEGIIVLE